eukprot:jgi/Chlat1/7619/Chrsp64S07104
MVNMALWEVALPLEDFLLVDEKPRKNHVHTHRHKEKTLHSDHGTPAMMATSVDVVERPDAFEFHADVPGVSKEDLSVQVFEGRVLSISGKRKREARQEGDRFHRAERNFGEFERRFKLPKLVDASKVSAKHDNGVLTVSVAKHKEVTPKAITVEVQ